MTELTDEALAAGARPEPACALLHIAVSTCCSWKSLLRQTGSRADRRMQAGHPPPEWRCSDEYRAQLVALCSRPEYAALTPYEICADQPDHHGRYLCSASTLYRVLAEHGQSVRRDRTRRPARHRPPAVHADCPNQVWMGDITCLRSHVHGMFYHLYVFTDLYDRSIAGSGVFAEESAEHAALLIRSICLEQGRRSTQPLILHSDNGAVMKSVQCSPRSRSWGLRLPSQDHASAMTTPAAGVCLEPSQSAMTNPRREGNARCRSAPASRPPSDG